MHEFFGLLPSDMEALLKEHSIPSAHIKTIFKNAYKNHSSSPWRAEGLPASLDKLFAEAYQAESLRLKSALISKYDQSVKFLFELVDGLSVETVLMPERSRLTACVSSQVGCAQRCSFCHTGRMGLVRQLSAAEIVGQLVSVNRWIAENPSWYEHLRANFQDAYTPTEKQWIFPKKITNVVFMGMGEPLDNVKAVYQSVQILKDQYALGLATRRITVSTAGHLDGLKELDTYGFDCSLALSLHIPDSKERTRIMPINKRYPIEDVIAYLKTRKTLKRQKLMIQYTLIDGVNDSDLHVDKLIKLLDGLEVKINIIPLNPIDPSSLKGPSLDSLTAFAHRVYSHGISTFVRYSKAQDIYGACGQLVNSQQA